MEITRLQRQLTELTDNMFAEVIIVVVAKGFNVGGWRSLLLVVRHVASVIRYEKKSFFSRANSARVGLSRQQGDGSATTVRRSMHVMSVMRV